MASAESYSFHFAYADNGSLTMTLESQNMNELSSVTKKDIMIRGGFLTDGGTN